MATPWDKKFGSDESFKAFVLAVVPEGEVKDLPASERRSLLTQFQQLGKDKEEGKTSFFVYC